MQTLRAFVARQLSSWHDWRAKRRPLTQEQIAVWMAEAWSPPKPRYRLTLPANHAKAEATYRRATSVYRAVRRGWYATATSARRADAQRRLYFQLTVLRRSA
jgi:hypothetical protein